jgi:hypothetical protein
VSFRHALDALRELRPLPLGVAVFSDATSFKTPRRAMFGQLAAQATELWRFALDGEGGKLRLIGEKSCSPGLLSRADAKDQLRELSSAGREIPRL